MTGAALRQIGLTVMPRNMESERGHAFPDFTIIAALRLPM